MLDEDNNRFSINYTPIMERKLLGVNNVEGVRLLNSRFMDDSPSLNADSCFNGRVIAFTSRVSSASIQPCPPLSDLLQNRVDVGDFVQGARYTYSYCTRTRRLHHQSCPPLPEPPCLHSTPTQINTILTRPMMRTWCKAHGTPLFIAPAHDVYTSHKLPGLLSR